jgi:hypothetical protein
MAGAGGNSMMMQQQQQGQPTQALQQLLVSQIQQQTGHLTGWQMWAIRSAIIKSGICTCEQPPLIQLSAMNDGLFTYGME